MKKNNKAKKSVVSLTHSVLHEAKDKRATTSDSDLNRLLPRSSGACDMLLLYFPRSYKTQIGREEGEEGGSLSALFYCLFLLSSSGYREPRNTQVDFKKIRLPSGKMKYKKIAPSRLCLDDNILISPSICRYKIFFGKKDELHASREKKSGSSAKNIKKSTTSRKIICIQSETSTMERLGCQLKKRT